MNRRQFIAGLGSAAAVWPLGARAQPRDAVKRIAWVSVAIDAEADETFRRELARLGWVEGSNLRIEVLNQVEDRIVRATAPFIVGTLRTSSPWSALRLQKSSSI
jgi:hypothetical protein